MQVSAPFEAGHCLSYGDHKETFGVDKVRPEDSKRNKLKVFRVSLECLPQRESCIPSIHITFIVITDCRRPKE